MKNIVFTWWTHVWKTSVLEYLETQWYSRYISVAWANMRMLHDLLWDERYPDYRSKNFAEFQLANIYDDAKLYHQSLATTNTKDDVLFFDRWVFDWIASLKREAKMVSDSIEELVSKVSYDLVFIFDPIANHDSRNETARLLNREVSEKWANFIETEYINRWYKIVHVPDLQWTSPSESIKLRAEFILSSM